MCDHFRAFKDSFIEHVNFVNEDKVEFLIFVDIAVQHDDEHITAGGLRIDRDLHITIFALVQIGGADVFGANRISVLETVSYN